MKGKIKINRKELLQILNKYYESEKGKATIKSRVDYIGMYEEEGCVTDISVQKNINISGINNKITEIIDEEKLLEILGELLNSDGYQVLAVELLNNLERRTEGYGCGETTKNHPKFDGIELSVQKVNNKQLVKEMKI